MAPRVSGKRYAQAIFEIAVEQNQLDQWETDLAFVFRYGWFAEASNRRSGLGQIVTPLGAV